MEAQHSPALSIVWACVSLKIVLNCLTLRYKPVFIAVTLPQLPCSNDRTIKQVDFGHIPHSILEINENNIFHLPASIFPYKSFWDEMLQRRLHIKNIIQEPRQNLGDDSPKCSSKKSQTKWSFIAGCARAYTSTHFLIL